MKSFDVEIDDKPQVEFKKSQVCQDLSTMNWKDLGDRFDLHNDQSTDYQVKAIATLHYHFSVPQWKSDLLFKLYSPEDKLPAEAGFIG